MKSGNLILIPNLLGDETEPKDFLGENVFKKIKELKYFIVENEKVARRFLKKMELNSVLQDLTLQTLNKHTHPEQIKELLFPALKGENIGLLSDAGCPCIADPGALAVIAAHNLGIRVEPLVGPSSILLALISSGINGQNFAFNGYLPIDKTERKKTILELERRAHTGQTQLFMETPYRNMVLLEELLKTLKSSTQLSIACNLTLTDEYINSLSVGEWKKTKISLNKKPCVFVIG
ncbi:MAG: SAM-dependent methyltransferase [Flavobacteriales bacterium]